MVTIWSTYGDYHAARVKALSQHGFEVIPFAHGDYDPSYKFFNAKPNSLVVINTGDVTRIHPLLSWWRTWRLLRHYRPDLILTAGYERAESFAASLYARTGRSRDKGRPVAIVMLDNRAQDHRRPHYAELAKSIYLRVFDGFLASGSDSRDYLQTLGVPASKIGLGYNCVDNEEIGRLVAKYRPIDTIVDEKGSYFLSISRLVAKKNIFGLVRAYQSYVLQLPASARPVPLVICGDGPERAAIEDLIVRSGLERSVTLVGEAIGMEGVAKQLAGCRALVLASTTDETWGLVVNEAMAAGCPVLVSTQSGCARDLVDNGVNGFTFDANDHDALARHLLWFTRNGPKLHKMGRRSKEVVGRFTPAGFAASVSTLVGVARRISGAG